jgi:hypothetical protein
MGPIRAVVSVAMNVFVKPFVFALAQALGAGANYASDGRHAAIRGLVTTFYAFVKESGCQLETHVQSFNLVQTDNANSLLNLRLLPGLVLG